MERIRLMIVDSDTQFVERLSRYLSRFQDIDLVSCESNGQEALRKIRALQLDTVLFDIVLPGLDGISLLRAVNEMREPPTMICCTRFYSDVAMEAVRNYGAGYLLFKPIETNTLHATILSCTETHQSLRKTTKLQENAVFSEDDLVSTIQNTIVSLGVPTKLVGCSYLVESVRLARMDMSLTRNLSKGLYLEVSRSMNTTPTCVERCIRNAINAAFQNGGLEGRMLSCPSNKEFINYVLRLMEL